MRDLERCNISQDVVFLAVVYTSAADRQQTAALYTVCSELNLPLPILAAKPAFFSHLLSSACLCSYICLHMYGATCVCFCVCVRV